MPATGTDVNLIPTELLAARRNRAKKTQVKKFAFGAIALSLLLLIASVAGWFYFNNQRKLKQAELDQKKAEIMKKEEFARRAGELTERLKQIDTSLKVMPQYSRLISEIRLRAPSSISITDISQTNESQFTVSGTATPNFPPVGEYQEALLADKDEPGSIFKDVSIASATFDATRGTVQFSFKVLIAPTSLYGTISSDQ